MEVFHQISPVNSGRNPFRHSVKQPEAKAFLDTSRLEGAQDALAAVVGILDQAALDGKVLCGGFHKLGVPPKWTV